MANHKKRQEEGTLAFKVLFVLNYFNLHDLEQVMWKPQNQSAKTTKNSKYREKIMVIRKYLKILMKLACFSIRGLIYLLDNTHMHTHHITHIKLPQSFICLSLIYHIQ